MVPIMGTMAFTRKKTRIGKNGRKLAYYSIVENRWEKGKVRQKVIKYLGTSPNKKKIPVDPKIVGKVALILMTDKITPSEVKEKLKKLGVDTGPGKIKRLSLDYNPPHRKFTLHIE